VVSTEQTIAKLDFDVLQLFETARNVILFFSSFWFGCEIVELSNHKNAAFAS